MTHTLHGTLTSVSKLLYVTKPNVMDSSLCETTHFGVPFLRTCLLKSERICVQCTEHRLKVCMGLFRNSKNWAFCCNGHQKSHFSSPHRGRWNIQFAALMSSLPLLPSKVCIFVHFLKLLKYAANSLIKKLPQTPWNGLRALGCGGRSFEVAFISTMVYFFRS